MQVNVQFIQQLQPEWSRFVTVVKQSKEIDTISYHTLFDILKQYQNEVNDIWKRISDKRTKNKAKNDKSKHGMEKRGKAKVKSKPISKKVKVKPEKSTVKTGADTKEHLMGPPEPI
ncbi:hypothetical protein Tco_0068044 [Tanacetum coccineum]